jgi:NAD(P)-dependent dehydrogenase (short-subunit alcohol dehydrogenase family)
VRRYSPWWQSRRLLYIRKRTDEWYFFAKENSCNRRRQWTWQRNSLGIFTAWRNRYSCRSKYAETRRNGASDLRDPGKSWVIPFDANNNQSIDNLFDEIKHKVGTLDIAVNNAGVFSFGFVDEASNEDFNHVFTTNVIGLFESLKRELQSMKENRAGTIVNISSNMSIGLNIPGTAAYTASKAAVDALTRVSAKEAITHGVRVFSINPGPLATEMTQLPGESAADRDKRWRDLIPIGRIGDVKEIAEAIIWSCSGQSDYLVGSRIVIDGGHSL